MFRDLWGTDVEAILTGDPDGRGPAFASSVLAPPPLPTQSGEFAQAVQVPDATPARTAYGFIDVDDDVRSEYEQARAYLGKVEIARLLIHALESGLHCGSFGATRLRLTRATERESRCRWDSTSHEFHISWNPLMACCDSLGNIMSPAVVLFHEMMHARHIAFDAKAWSARRFTHGILAMNREEDVTVFRDQQCSAALGEHVRLRAYSNLTPVDSPTSRKVEDIDRIRFIAYMNHLRNYGRNTHFESIDAWASFWDGQPSVHAYVQRNLAENTRMLKMRAPLRAALQEQHYADRWRDVSWKSRMHLTTGRLHLSDIFPELRAEIAAAVLPHVC